MWIIVLPTHKKLLYQAPWRMFYKMPLFQETSHLFWGTHSHRCFKGTNPKFQSYVHAFAKLSFQARGTSTQLYALVRILPLYRTSWVSLRNYKETRASSKDSVYRQKAWFLSGNSHFRISSLSTQLWKICRKTAPCDLHYKLLLSNNVWILLCWVQTFIIKPEEKIFIGYT